MGKSRTPKPTDALKSAEPLVEVIYDLFESADGVPQVWGWPG